jgi:hypothetical protein
VQVFPHLTVRCQNVSFTDNGIDLEGFDEMFGICSLKGRISILCIPPIYTATLTIFGSCDVESQIRVGDDELARANWP